MTCSPFCFLVVVHTRGGCVFIFPHPKPTHAIQKKTIQKRQGRVKQVKVTKNSTRHKVFHFIRNQLIDKKVCFCYFVFRTCLNEKKLSDDALCKTFMYLIFFYYY